MTREQITALESLSESQLEIMGDALDFYTEHDDDTFGEASAIARAVWQAFHKAREERLAQEVSQ